MGNFFGGWTRSRGVAAKGAVPHGIVAEGRNGRDGWACEKRLSVCLLPGLSRTTGEKGK